VVSLKLARKPPQKREKAIQLIDIVGMAKNHQQSAIEQCSKKAPVDPVG